MIEVVELFNIINNLQSSSSFESQARYARQPTRSNSLHQLDPKWLISNAASMNSTNSAHSRTCLSQRDSSGDMGSK